VFQLQWFVKANNNKIDKEIISHASNIGF